MKVTTEKLKNKFKQPRVIGYLIMEILINVMLYYPMSFAYQLAKETTTDFQFIYIATYMTVIGAVSGLLVFLSEKIQMKKFFTFLFFTANALIAVYIVLHLFKSWFGWVLLLFILGSISMVILDHRKGLSAPQPKEK